MVKLGTLSWPWQDALTDATAESIKLDIEGQEIYAHKGITQSAVYIRDKLEKEHILERAFQQAPVRNKQEETINQ